MNSHHEILTVCRLWPSKNKIHVNPPPPSSPTNQQRLDIPARRRKAAARKRVSYVLPAATCLGHPQTPRRAVYKKKKGIMFFSPVPPSAASSLSCRTTAYKLIRKWYALLRKDKKKLARFIFANVRLVPKRGGSPTDFMQFHGRGRKSADVSGVFPSASSMSDSCSVSSHIAFSGGKARSLLVGEEKICRTAVGESQERHKASLAWRNCLQNCTRGLVFWGSKAIPPFSNPCAHVWSQQWNRKHKVRRNVH